MRTGAVDVGTNSFLLLLAEVENGSIIEVLEEEIRMVRIGEGVSTTRKLQPAPMERSLDALQEFAAICQRWDVPVEQVVLGGTSALRDASNTSDFVKQVLRETGFRLEVISGEKEAGYAWRGVLSDAGLQQNQSPGLLDIGGGSTELLWADGEERKSVNIGVVRALEQFLHTDPPTHSERQNLHDEVLRLFAQTQPAIDVLFAVGGVVTTLVSVREKMEHYDSSRVHKSILTRTQIEELQALFCSMELEARKQLPGLPPQRADLIPAGAQILLAMLEFLEKDSLVVSERGLRYGLLLEAERRQLANG